MKDEQKEPGSTPQDSESWGEEFEQESRSPLDLDPSMMVDLPPGRFSSGYVALVGEPNVGKSTLMNRFLEQRIAIVTAKPQTTRRKTLGILHGDEYQMVLLDTPGIMAPKYPLHQAMIQEAVDALRDADLVVYLVEPRTKVELLEAVENVSAPRLLVVNKIDTLGSKDELLPILDQYDQLGSFEDLIPISAKTGEGVDGLLQTLISRLPDGPPFYPPDLIADQPERFFVAEIIREQLFELFDQEVPYASEVIIDDFKERETAKDFISANIFVETDSQKRILIGKGGQAIRSLGECARTAVEVFLGRDVFLELRVKRMPKWRRKSGSLKKLGYKA